MKMKCVNCRQVNELSKEDVSHKEDQGKFGKIDWSEFICKFCKYINRFDSIPGIKI